MCGQAYDGASNMSGKTNGAAARISSQYLLALYTHCTSHCLNLAVMASFEGMSICYVIGVVKQLSILFYTPQASEEVGRSYTEHPARIERVEDQRSLQNKMD